MRPFHPARVHRPVVITLAATLVFLLACTSRKPGAVAEAAPPPTETVRIVKGDPPATSQLALLMREMTAFTDSTGKRLATSEHLLPYPERFKELMTAEATPGMVERRTFDPFAQAWLNQLDALYATPSAEQTGVFNTLVQTCAACHSQMCPGPLVRIKKLTIPEVED
ncbi:MAG: hypothetical protein K8H89_06915 [Flavobacteriales bacterium]|jgi:hypothetical protein|nr:hypothetical protein [Flavobacteriales bacterium]MCB0758920.1 hypothetical protein [Flavobacteriales bacterium]